MDEKRRHHEVRKKLSEKTFFRLDPQDFTVIMRGTEFSEERYSRSKEFWNKRVREGRVTSISVSHAGCKPSLVGVNASSYEKKCGFILL